MSNFRLILLPALLFFSTTATTALQTSSPWAALWTTPAIVIASLFIAWGAESAQFFVAQGFALAILAWMQTLPEFAVEAVLAWRQQTPLLMANLTGALRLLTGLAWPLIYVTAAIVYRRNEGKPLRAIRLNQYQSVEIVALMPPLLYALFIAWKSSLTVYDAGVLALLYLCYLVLLTRLPPEGKEGVEDLETIPRTIVQAKPVWRNLTIAALFMIGGALIYFTAEPFLGSLVSVAAVMGVPDFLVIQWLAPVISEFPELASTFHFARQEGKPPVALMNIVSSNINQWTLLVGILPVVLSLSHGQVTDIIFDAEQQSELTLTVAQSFTALTFLLNMEFTWQEALAMILLFLAQFILPHQLITLIFAAWTIAGLGYFLWQRPQVNAFSSFAKTWRAVVSN